MATNSQSRKLITPSRERTLITPEYIAQKQAEAAQSAIKTVEDEIKKLNLPQNTNVSKYGTYDTEIGKATRAKELYDSLSTYLAGLKVTNTGLKSSIDEINKSVQQNSAYYGGLSDYFNKAKKYYGEFKDEEDYNQKVIVPQMQNEEWASADTVALKTEIDGLESNYNSYKSLKSQRDKLYSAIVSGYMRAGYKKENAEKVALSDSRIAKYDKELSQYGDISKTLSDKKQFYNNATRIQEGIALHNNAINAEDFGNYSAANVDFADDRTYKYINDIDGFRKSEGDYWLKNGTYTTDQGFVLPTVKPLYMGANYEHMTEEEIGIFNYYYNKFGAKKANEYLKNLEQTLNTRSADEIRKQSDTDFERIMFGAAAGLDQFKSGIKNLVNTQDSYITPSDIQIASGMIREDLEDSGAKILGSSIGQIGYDLVNTTSNMLPSILASTVVGWVNPAAGAAVGASLMGGSAAGNAYSEMLNLGYDKEQARGYSILVGASEATLQYVLGGISSLGGTATKNITSKIATKLASKVDNAIAKVAINTGTKLVGSMISEFGEEYLQEVLTPVFKNLTLKTEEDVKLFSAEALYAGILGALSAGLLEGGSTVSSEVGTYKSGKNVIEKGQLGSLTELGKMYSPGTEAYNLANQVDKNADAYTVGQLLQEVGAESLTESNVADIEKSLVRKNVLPEDAKTIAKWIYKASQGEVLTKTQQSAIYNNPDIVTTLKEVAMNPKSTVNQRTQGYQELLDNLERGTTDTNIEATSHKPNVDSDTVKGYNTNRGGINELSNRTGALRGNQQPQETNSGGVSQSRRTWEEDEESFKRRASQDTEGTGQRRRILLENGDSLFAYTPAEADNSEASRAVDFLKSIGIDAIYCEGDTESNKNGKTTVHSEAVTAPDGTVYVSSNSSLSSIHIAAHEAVHVNEIKQTEAYDRYKNVVSDNVLWGSDAYFDIANRINQGNYGGKYDINDISFANKFTRELTAYVNEFVSADIDKATKIFSSMFKDWEAVVEASKQFNKDIGADFTESALLMPQNDSTDSSSDESILTEPSVKKADSDPVRDSVFELSGRQSYTPEQLKVVTVARKFGRKVIFEDTIKTQGFRSDGYFDSDGNIHLDYDTVRPLEWVLKHELTHFGEGTNAYNEYVDLLRKTKAYKKWLQKELKTDEESLGKLEGLMREKIMKEREAVAPINPIEAQAEIIANFSATFAFAKDSRGIEALTADMNLKEHNAFVQFILDFISYLKKKLGGSNKTLTKELSVLEDRYLKMLTYKAQNPTTEKNSGNKYSIVALENGNLYVSASRRVIAGNDISNWRSQITDFFKTLLDNNESLEIQTVEGDTLTITMSETAHKARDNYKQVAGKPVRMTDSEFKVKLNVEAHIDEITEISKENKNSATPDSKNHGFAKDGFTYRTAYFEDFDGQYYRITLSIGENNNVATVYNVGKIKKEALPSAKIIAVVGSKALGSTSNNNVPQNEPVVNNNSMQEAAKNSQENISRQKNNGNKYSISVENENDGVYNNEEDNSISEDAISDRINNNFYQEFLNDMPIDEYNKLTVKKPIRVTKDIFAAVNSARTQFYGDAATEDIPIIDIINLGEYGVLNSDDFYFIRNANRTEFSIIKHAKTLKGRNNKYVDIRGRQKRNPTNRGNNSQNGPVRIEGKNNSSNRNNRPSTNKSAFRENANKTQFVEETNGRTGVGNSASDFRRGIDSTNNSKIQYSIPTEADELLDRYESGEISREEFMSEVDGLYNRAVDTFAPIKRGERHKNETNVPRRVEKDKKTHRFVRTIIESDTLTDEMLDDVKTDMVLGNFSYKAVSDESAKKKADQYIKNGRAESVWDNAVNGSPVHISKEMIAVGEKLYLQAVENNDRKRVLELSGELCDVLTRAGQVVQAARMLKQMTGLEKLMAVQRMVKTINKDLAEKYGEDKAPFIRIDEVLAEQLANLKPGQEYEIVIRNIMEDVAAQIPSTFLDKWNAWRYFAMLANPRTHIRNLVGNGIFTPSIRIKDFIASGMEAAFVRDTSKRTKSAVIKPEYMDFAKEDVKKREAKAMLQGNGQLDDRSSLESMKKIFETEWLDKAVKGNTNLMEAEDMLFKSIHYRHALAGFLQARKVDLKNVDEKTLNEAREYAVNEAKKATFQDFSYAAEMLNQLRLPKHLRKTTAGKVVDFTGQVLMGGLLPFKRTPINIIKRGIEYSPLGLAQTTIRGLYQVRKGNFNVSQFCDGLAANLTGTGLLLLGMLLCSQGLVTGGFDDDEEDRIKKLNGEQEYSVQIFGKSFTIDWAAPACIPFFIGVEVLNAFEDTEDFKLSSITKAVWNALEPITNLSMLSGIQSVISSAAYADDSQKLAAIVSDIVLSYVTQGIPSLLGATSRTIDSTQRSWYNDKNSQFDTYAQLAGNTVASKVPGLSYLQIPSFDEWGRAKSRGKVGERAMENFISPGYFSSVQYDEVETELKEVFEATGERTFPTVAEKSFKVNGETKHLTADEYVVFAQAKGEMSFEYAKEFVNSAQYKKLTDAERAKVIGNLYKYATAKAKAKVSDYDITDSFKTVSKWEKNGKSVVTYYIGRALDN